MSADPLHGKIRLVEKLPHMTVDPVRPGVIIFDGDPLTGMLAGIRAREIAAACNAHERLIEAGDRIVALVSRCSDQATDEQRSEHERFEIAIRKIWEDAKAPR